jgi:hypothetical protein
MTRQAILWKVTLGFFLWPTLVSTAVAQDGGEPPAAAASPEPRGDDIPSNPPPHPNEAGPGGAIPLPAPFLPGRGGALGGWLNPNVGQLLYHADYRVTWFPDESVAGQGTRLGYVQQDFLTQIPICQDSCNEWSATARVRAELFHTGAILPDTRQPFPNDLWNIGLGTAYRHLFDNGYIGGLNVSVGSASDKPFSTINEMSLAATAFVRVPQGEHNAWLFTLNFSSNSEVLSGIPIPGVAYLWVPSEWFQATIGFPFASVVYRPCDDLTLLFTYALLRTVHVRAVYRMAPAWRVYGSFDMENENYFLAERFDERSRFFYYDSRLSAGVQWNVCKEIFLDLSGGYVFDRYYFEGRSIRDSHFNRVNVGDGPFVMLNAGVKY